MTRSNFSGKIGEEIALNYLMEKGVEILEKNWRWRNLEIDLIGVHNKKLVIYEVKTRKSEVCGEPASFVTRKKQKLLIQAANKFIEERSIKMETQFDIISILYQEKKHQINHLEDAFQPEI